MGLRKCKEIIMVRGDSRAVQPSPSSLAGSSSMTYPSAERTGVTGAAHTRFARSSLRKRLEALAESALSSMRGRIRDRQGAAKSGGWSYSLRSFESEEMIIVRAESALSAMTYPSAKRTGRCVARRPCRASPEPG